MTNIKGLVCTNCGKPHKAAAVNRCEVCFNTLDVEYNYSRIKKLVTRKRIRKGPATIWRYKDFLPVDSDSIVDLSAGFTPLQRADRLGERLGIKNLFIKNDTLNPTFSIKDRMVSVAVSRGLELGFDTFACASTGNLAHSLAAHAARAGVVSFIFIPKEAEELKLSTISVYDPVLLTVDGTTADMNRLCLEIMKKLPWGFVNVNLRAYYAEGAKTIMYEIVEQMDWKVPDHVVMPVASGTTLVKARKGLVELEETELIRKAKTVFHGVQAAGCAPVVEAFEAGSELIRPVPPDTIAKSLAVGNPTDGAVALKTIRDTGGQAVSATDEEMLEGVRMLAETEGILAEPAGGAAVMAARKLALRRAFKSSDDVVICITGMGLKTIDSVRGVAMQPSEIAPTMEALDAAVSNMKRKKFVPGAPAKNQK